jgi:trehalose 6-phosphate synthase
MADTEEPVVLVQDYHFALVPRMIKEQRPDARVSIFWHIPWPNPEAFAICPWQKELLDGLLGADLIGFHVQAHCNNFLNSVDRALESQINWEFFTAKRNDHVSMVRPFPISVDLADTRTSPTARFSSEDERTKLFRELQVDGIFLGVGVDRVDYTKGIVERFLAIERLLELYPVYQRQFVFVQIGAPSRTHIQRYKDFMDEVRSEAERINRKFQSGNWRPIVFLNRQHSHDEVQRFYRAADLCLVTSLHDGMNLVAKEFLAARSDEDGVLVLSRFTGAARELRDALMVNPYDIDQTAEAIRSALEMDPRERKERMQRMRRQVRENNIYRWAGDLIGQLCEFRVPTSKVTSGSTESHSPAA